MSTSLAQLPLFDNRPLPEIIADLYGFPLARHEQENGLRHYAVQDWIVGVGQVKNARRYWSDLSKRHPELYAPCVQFLYTAANGRSYNMDYADAETLYRITQRMDANTGLRSTILDYLAAAGVKLDEQRIEQIQKQIPVRQTKRYRQHIEANYTPDLAEQAIETRDSSKSSYKLISSEWRKRGVVTARDFGRLNNTVTVVATGRTVQDWRDLLQIGKNSPRDYFSALKNTTIDVIQQYAASFHKARNTHGTANLQHDIEDAASIIDHRRLREMFPDMDLESPATKPEQKRLTD